MSMVTKVHEAIKALCDKNSITLEKLSEVTGVEYSHLLWTSIINPESSKLTTTDLSLIANYFRLNFQALLTGEIKEEGKTCFVCESRETCIAYRLAIDMQFLFVLWAEEKDGPELEAKLSDELYSFVGKICPRFHHFYWKEL